MRVGVTGAAGAVGSQVVRGLVAAGTGAVVAMVRDRRRAPAHPAVTAVEIDYADERRMLDAMTDVDVLVFVGSDGPADEVMWHHHVVVSAAARRAVRRIVVLSSQDARADSPFCYARVYARTEAWARSLPDVVVVRAGLYAEFFAGFLRNRPHPASLRLPTGGRGVAPVTRSDVADCLVAAALGGDGRPTYTLTGPQTLRLADLAALAGRSSGDVAPRECTGAEFRRDLLRSSSEAWWDYAFASMFEAIAQGAFEAVSTDVDALLGRPPTSFEAAWRAVAR